MKSSSCVCAMLLVLHSFAAGSDVNQSVNPIQKVLQLLSGLEDKIEKDAAAELKAYEEYMAMCKDGVKDKGFQIKTAQNEIEDLGATIEKAKSDITTQDDRISDLASAVVQNEADLKAATEIREKEKAEFLAAETELVDVIDTLDRAINILQRKLAGSSLAQTKVNTKDVPKLVETLNTVVEAADLSVSDKERLVSLVQGGAADKDEEEDEALDAPEPKAYESHGEGIVEVLEDLRAKAQSELSAQRQQEVKSTHHYELLKQSLEDQVKADTKEMGQAKSTKAAAAESLSTAEGDLSVTQKTLDDTKTALAALEAGCKTAVSDHESEVQSRADELKAIAEAKKIIAETTGGSEGIVYSSAAFLQINGEKHLSLISTRADLANVEVVHLLRRLAKQEHSAALSQLASRVAAAVRYGARSGDDPFAKVKALIKEMVARLEKEAGEEAKHKAWCDEQLGDTLEKKDQLEQSINSLSAKIDKEKAESVTLKDEVASLQATLSELMKEQAEMDKARLEEHDSFVKVKIDLEDGLKGIRAAVKILRDYYADNGSAHKKSTGSGSSIIGLLEVVESDISKTLAEAITQEDASAAAYQKVSMTNKISKTSYEQDVKYKTKAAASLDKSVAELSSDREASQTELDSVLEYSKSIREACEVKPENYAERKSRRDTEIAGLKEALQILEGEAVLLQQKDIRLRGTFITLHHQ